MELAAEESSVCYDDDAEVGTDVMAQDPAHYIMDWQDDYNLRALYTTAESWD